MTFHKYVFHINLCLSLFQYMDGLHSYDEDIITAKIIENEKPKAQAKSLRLGVRRGEYI